MRSRRKRDSPTEDLDRPPIGQKDVGVSPGIVVLPAPFRPSSCDGSLPNRKDTPSTARHCRRSLGSRVLRTSCHEFVFRVAVAVPAIKNRTAKAQRMVIPSITETYNRRVARIGFDTSRFAIYGSWYRSSIAPEPPSAFHIRVLSGLRELLRQPMLKQMSYSPAGRLSTARCRIGF